MTHQDFKNAMRVLATIAVGLAIVFGLIAGATIGCTAQAPKNSRANAVRVHNDTRVEFYKLCQRRFQVGLFGPAECRR